MFKQRNKEGLHFHHHQSCKHKQRQIHSQQLYQLLLLVSSPKWEGLLAVRKLTQTKERGPKKKMIVLSLISELTARGAGAHFLKPQAFSDAGRVAGFAGSTTSVPTSNAATSPKKKTSSSSSSIAFLVTSKCSTLNRVKL